MLSPKTLTLLAESAELRQRAERSCSNSRLLRQETRDLIELVRAQSRAARYAARQITDATIPDRKSRLVCGECGSRASITNYHACNRRKRISLDE